jgi:phospholipase C
VTRIDHVVVLMLENRSFDHMLGFLDHPDPAFDGLRRGGPHTNPGWDGGPDVAATPEAKRVLPYGPAHTHAAVMEQLAVTGSGAGRRPANTGFVTSYERTGRGLGAKPRPWITRLVDVVLRRTPPAAVSGRGDLVMLCQPERHVPVLSRLALDFAVCTRWFCSVPGETWPNRNFLHAATSDGEVDIDLRPFDDPTIFELLETQGATWRVYHDDTPQVWAFPALWDVPARHANWHPFSHFAEHVAAGKLPAYSFIEPDHRPALHEPGHEDDGPARSDNQHPENNLVPNDAYDAVGDVEGTDFERGDALIASVYEALRANPELFSRTLLVVTYDEHGGLYDHVPPPVDVPPPGDRQSLPTRLANRLLERLGLHPAVTFDFTMLGPRVPAVVVSPLVPAGTVDATVRDHACVPATLRALFAPDAAPLTRRDAWSPPVHGLLRLDEPRTDLPDLSAYVGRGAGTRSAMLGGSAGRSAMPEPGGVPDYYREFVELADGVDRRLRGVGEPEALAAAPPAGPPLERAADVTATFERAAARHRDQETST